MDPIPGLDGSRRQEVAAGLWNAWQEEGRAAAVLTGFSGLGKTERVVLPLVAQARAEGRIAVLVDVPQRPTNLSEELVARLVEELCDNGDAEVADAAGAELSFASAVQQLLRQGALVVLDEFQRVLDPSSATPLEPLAEKIRKLATRIPDGGCLWLVSNRMVDPEWTEPFYSCRLEAPSDITDLEHIVLQAIGTQDAEDRFPADRRVEVVGRLGQNPRALRLLGQLLQIYPLDELLGLPQAVPEGLTSTELTDRIERSLLAKARAGLSDAATEFLRDLAVLREPGHWELLKALGEHLGDVTALSRELRERFVLEIRGNRYYVHPVVREVELPRLRGDAEAFRAAHRRAGSWFAARLPSETEALHNDAGIALDLAGARYHLTEALAFDDLRDALRVIGPYIERKFHWTAESPSDAAELDAQIALLELFLEEPGSVSVEYQLAKRLKTRDQPGDLARALPHAQRATADQEFSDPWVLRIQLVYLVQGRDSTIELARQAVDHVDPAKNIFAVYQLWGAALNHDGRDVEAVDICLEGAEREKGLRSRRLIEEALYIAAAMPSTDQLSRVGTWAAEKGDFQAQVALADVLLHERSGAWKESAETARIMRRRYPTYLHPALHEAIGWLGAGAPDEAQQALDSFPGKIRLRAREGATWIASFVALRCGDLARAAEVASRYIDGDTPTTAKGVESMLLREWDHRVGTIGEANPAYSFPVLPTSLTNLSRTAVRPQHGPPVLPQHRGEKSSTEPDEARRPRILAVGTEWRSGHGGLSTFNRQLCCALADAGANVVCLTLQAPPEDVSDAWGNGVTLVEATPTPGLSEHQALSRRPASLPEGFVPDLIIGHGRVTGPAAAVLAEDHFPQARRLQFVHTAPDEIEWHKLDREDDAGMRAEERTQLELDLGRTAHRVVAVGPTLYDRYARDLYGYDGVPTPIRFDPGFDFEIAAGRQPPPGAPWKILLVGRAEDYHLKGLDLAASAVGLTESKRGPDLPDLEFVVRGAEPGRSDELRELLRNCAASPALRIVVRPYSPSTETLVADMRSASLVLMPSREEGFGLVGLEALVAGTPALITSRSGLGQLLRQTLDPEQFARVVVTMTGDDQEDTDRWARSINGMILDRPAAFQRAFELQAILGSRTTWRSSVSALFSELKTAS